MYFAAVVLLLFVLPTGSVLVEKLALGSALPWMALVGKWFVFWAVGVRLFVTGMMQSLQPQFTAERIFELKEPAALGVVREVGFGNLAMGSIGLASLWLPAWLVPAAVAGGLYYGLAGIGHQLRGGGNFLERTAMLSDYFIFVLLAAFVAWSRF